MRKILLVVAVVAGLVVGCTTLDKMYDTKTVYTTNYVSIPILVTNVDTGAVTGSTNTMMAVHEETVLVPKQVIVDGLAASRNIIPIPYADVLAGLLGLAYAGYASWRNRRNQSVSNQVIGTLVDNIDTAKDLLGKISPQEQQNYVAAIKVDQKEAGVREEIKTFIS